MINTSQLQKLGKSEHTWLIYKGTDSKLLTILDTGNLVTFIIMIKSISCGQLGISESIYQKPYIKLVLKYYRIKAV